MDGFSRNLSETVQMSTREFISIERASRPVALHETKTALSYDVTESALHAAIPASAKVTFSRAGYMLTTPRAQPKLALTTHLWSMPWQDLTAIIQQDAQLAEAIHRRFSESVSHVGFDELTPAWIRKFAPTVLRAIGRFKDVQQWTFAETTLASMAIDRIVSDLLDYLGLPQAHTLACTALVIIFIKGLGAKGRADPDGKL